MQDSAPDTVKMIVNLFPVSVMILPGSWTNLIPVTSMMHIFGKASLDYLLLVISDWRTAIEEFLFKKLYSQSVPASIITLLNCAFYVYFILIYVGTMDFPLKSLKI